MLKRVDAASMGSNNLDWLKTKFHFSFSNYYNPNRMEFGVLRVFNDDLIKAKRGFEMHHHRDVEIVTYVVDGNLTHQDSMGNKSTIGSGDVQYMSAGTGVYHSEHNFSDSTLRTIQIWIKPDKKSHIPTYGDFKFSQDSQVAGWLHIVSSKSGSASVRINQDVNIYVAKFSKDKSTSFDVLQGRQAYLVQLDGKSLINNCALNVQDALEVIEENLNITCISDCHFMIIEMKKQG